MIVHQDNPRLQQWYQRGMTSDTLAIVNLWNDGFSCPQIAAKLGKSVGSVRNSINRARDKGMDVRSRVINPETRRRHLMAGRRSGSMTDMIDSLPDGVVRWLVDNAPKELTLAQFVRAIVIDAYHDEMETGN